MKNLLQKFKYWKFELQKFTLQTKRKINENQELMSVSMDKTW